MYCAATLPPMHKLDLNLLHALAALLREESVVGASRRLGITPSATSRALARLRDVTGDPLLVRAGRGLVPSPRAARLKQQLPQVMEQVQSLLAPEDLLNPKALERVFTVRCREGFAETFGASMFAAMAQAAPQSRLNFVQKTDKSSSMLREGSIDLEIGVLSNRIGPEVRSRRLFEDGYVAALSPAHPVAEQELDVEMLRSYGVIGLLRDEMEPHFAEHAMLRAGLDQSPRVMVASYGAAIALARQSELIAIVPRLHTAGLLTDIGVAELPFETPAFPVSLLWHPRFEADPAHRWLRSVVTDTVGAQMPRLRRK